MIKASAPHVNVESGGFSIFDMFTAHEDLYTLTETIEPTF